MLKDDMTVKKIRTDSSVVARIFIRFAAAVDSRETLKTVKTVDSRISFA